MFIHIRLIEKVVRTQLNIRILCDVNIHQSVKPMDNKIRYLRTERYQLHLEFLDEIVLLRFHLSL